MCGTDGVVTNVASGSKLPGSPSSYCSDGKVQIATCPCPPSNTFGQDGNFKLNLPSYTVSATTVVDGVTGLEWERTPPSTPSTWQESVDRCAALGADWRLPTRYELLTLSDTGREPAIDTSTFGTDLLTYGHWSSTPYAPDVQQVWIFLYFAGGVEQPSGKDFPGVSRCVKGTSTTQSFDTTVDTVTDKRSGLMWQRSIDPLASYQWYQALAYCNNLVAGGYDDWRLPTVKEAQSLVSDTSPTMPLLAGGIFPNTYGGEMWTSTPYYALAERVYTLRLNDGTVGNIEVKFVSGAEIHCVR